jgi:hypothetical protein
MERTNINYTVKSLYITEQWQKDETDAYLKIATEDTFSGFAQIIEIIT